MLYVCSNSIRMLKKILLASIPIGRFRLPVAVLLWFLATVGACIAQLAGGLPHINNFLIFKYVFHHVHEQQHLYHNYPDLYFDSNHYGPVFSAVIAPFALLPVYVGCLLWCLANAVLLYVAIKRMPFSRTQQHFMLLFLLNDLVTATQNTQFNPMLTSWMLLALILVQQQKEGWATLFIALGILTKIYGIVCLSLFFFSSNKWTFVWSFVLWMIILIVLPMLYSSPSFVLQCYADWYASLVEKNDINFNSLMQDMSIMRAIRNMIGVDWPNTVYLGFAAILTLAPLAQYRKWNQPAFQWLYLFYVMIGLVIFSSSSESSTYIIAVTGVAGWYVFQDKQNKWLIALVILVLIFTAMGTTDLFPKSIRNGFIRPYGIKAIPCFFVWLTIFYQLVWSKLPSIPCAHAEKDQHRRTGLQ